MCCSCIHGDAFKYLGIYVFGFKGFVIENIPRGPSVMKRLQNTWDREGYCESERSGVRLLRALASENLGFGCGRT